MSQPSQRPTSSVIARSGEPCIAPAAAPWHLPQVVRVLVAAVLLVSTGCVGAAWKSAVREDTPSGYYRFLREHPESKYTDEARERLDFHKLKRQPTLSGYDRFRETYPESELLSALQPVLERPAFEAARAQGTAAAYRDFLESFGDGAYAARAKGNAVYFEREGFGGDPVELAAFASEYPESDFAPEAERTARAVAARAGERIERVGLVIDVPASTPEARRVRQALRERIEKLTERVGVELVPVPDLIDPAESNRIPRARLEVSHRERAVETGVESGALGRASRLGETQVVLREREGGEVIASRRFELRIDDQAWVPGTSVLFSAEAPRYWNEFFVPIARWRNDTAIRPPVALQRSVAALEGAGDRVVVLYEDGDFDLIGLADPTEPVVLSSYDRGEDFKRWSGVRVIDHRIAIYGEEGLELVAFTPEGPVAQATWTRSDIGRVLALASVGDQLVVAGASGMQLLDPETGSMRRILRRVVLGVESAGDVLFFVDGESVYVSDLELLAQGRVIAQMKLGRTFGPKSVRVLDQAAIVTGPGGALVIDVRDPRAPKAMARLAAREVGEVYDATRVRGRTYLVGQRGLQLLDRSLRRVEETIDVGRRSLVTVMGRHLVTAEGSSLQVVDSTPWAESSMPAASEPAAAVGSVGDRTGR